MKILKIFCFFILTGNVLGYDLSTKIPQLQKYIEKTLNEWDVPGAAIGIIQDGKVILSKTYGVKEKGKSEKIDEHTLFCLASVSKNITAFLLQKLVDLGKIKWDDKVIKYLPDFFLISKEITEELTIEDLVSHRCGLKAFAGDSIVSLGGDQKDIIDFLAKLEGMKKFKIDYTYQNQVFGIATLVIEKVCAKSFKSVLKEYILDPLLMHDSYSGMPDHSIMSWFKNLFSKANTSTPHSFRNKKLTPTKPSKDDYTFEGSTGINSSLHDMIIWLKHFVSSYNENNEIYKAHTKPKNFKEDDNNFPPTRISDVSYCIGCFKMKFGKETIVYSQMGSFPGWRNLIFMIPKYKIGVIILSNCGGFAASWAPEAIEHYILDLISENEEFDWSAKFLEKSKISKKKQDQFDINEKVLNARPHLELSKYVGEFHNDLYGVIKIKQSGDKLYLCYKNKEAVLTHRTASSFEIAQNAFSEHNSQYLDPIVYFSDDLKMLDCGLFYEGKNTIFKKVE